MKRAFRVSLCAVALSVPVAPVQALDSSFHFKVGYDIGGDTVATVLFTDGETDNIKANEGLFFGAGVSVRNAAANIESEIAVSYKLGGVIASNGDVTWSSLPIEALVFYRWPSIRAGVGVAYHLGPGVDGSGAGSGVDAEFKDAAGGVLQLDYRVSEKLNIGLRYTSIEFEEEGSGTSFDGKTVGIVFSGSL